LATPHHVTPLPGHNEVLVTLRENLLESLSGGGANP